MIICDCFNISTKYFMNELNSCKYVFYFIILNQVYLPSYYTTKFYHGKRGVTRLSLFRRISKNSFKTLIKTSGGFFKLRECPGINELNAQSKTEVVDNQKIR